MKTYLDSDGKRHGYLIGFGVAPDWHCRKPNGEWVASCERCACTVAGDSVKLLQAAR